MIWLTANMTLQSMRVTRGRKIQIGYVHKKFCQRKQQIEGEGKNYLNVTSME